MLTTVQTGSHISFQGVGMKSFGVFSFVFLFFALPSAFAETKPCLDVGQVKELRAALTFSEDIVDSDICAPDSNTYQLFNTLIFMKNLRFEEAAVPAPFNQGILSGNFWDYFIKRASLLENQGATGGCDGIIAFTLGALKDGKIYICPSFYKDDMTMAERVSIMLHEVRHFDGFSHELCTNPLNKGGVNCDVSIDEKGAYAVTIESLAKMALAAPDLDARSRATAKSLILLFSQLVFNEKVVIGDGSIVGSYFISEDNKDAYMFNGKEFSPAVVFENAHLISRYFSLNVFPDDKSDVYTADLLSPSPYNVQAFGGAAKKYNALPLAERSQVIDILINPTYQAVVRANELEVKDLALVTTTWTAQAVFTAEELGDKELDAFYVLDTDSKLHYVNWKSGTTTVTDAAPLVTPLRATMIFEGQRFALSMTGEVLVASSADAKLWAPYAPMAGKKFRLMTRPFLWTALLYSK